METKKCLEGQGTTTGKRATRVIKCFKKDPTMNWRIGDARRPSTCQIEDSASVTGNASSNESAIDLKLGSVQGRQRTSPPRVSDQTERWSEDYMENIVERTERTKSESQSVGIRRRRRPRSTRHRAEERKRSTDRKRERGGSPGLFSLLQVPTRNASSKTCKVLYGHRYFADA